MPDMGDHFMADHIEHDEDFNWNEDVKPLWKPQEISAGEYNYIVNTYIVNTVHMLCRIINLVFNSSNLAQIERRKKRS